MVVSAANCRISKFRQSITNEIDSGDNIGRSAQSISGRSQTTHARTTNSGVWKVNDETKEVLVTDVMGKVLMVVLCGIVSSSVVACAPTIADRSNEVVINQNKTTHPVVPRDVAVDVKETLNLPWTPYRTPEGNIAFSFDGEQVLVSHVTGSLDTHLDATLEQRPSHLTWMLTARGN
jgi:hypothetical protein